MNRLNIEILKNMKSCFHLLREFRICNVIKNLNWFIFFITIQSGVHSHDSPLGIKQSFLLKFPVLQEKSYELRVAVDNSVVDLSSSSSGSGENEGLLLPEFNDLVKEYDFASSNSGKEAETPRSDLESPKVFMSSAIGEYDQEVRHLTNMVKMLQERERNLEIQLLEYYGLKEQETAVMELQNRLKINTMETKLLTLKIESLQADNKRLEAQMADREKIVAELEAARSKVKFLKKKLRSEVEQNKEQILILQKRVAKLQEQEYNSAASDSDTLEKLQRLKVLEDEAEELRKCNTKLQLENSELAKKLESTQMLAISMMEDPEVIGQLAMNFVIFLLYTVNLEFKCWAHSVADGNAQGNK